MTEQANRQLDITGLLCPMTFVKTRLLLERMAPGEIAEIIMRDGEPLKNVPAAVQDLGHRVLSIEETAEAGIYRVRIRVAAS
ncbi:sulfurtransferase TusA family protein [Iodidimonas sp. SYSU 1G8]|uniref:sulfurtransferase TusA family protein n=1 Tax=Iodidimonas sp. SYSU 1G8 TaxID=3133967 RepID=UPI0031FEB1A6